MRFFSTTVFLSTNPLEKTPQHASLYGRLIFFRMNIKTIFKYTMGVGAFGAIAGGGILGALHLSAALMTYAPFSHDAEATPELARTLTQQKCADCHGATTDTFHPLLNALSLGMMQRDVDGGQRAYTLSPAPTVRAASVDLLKMDQVLTRRHMPPLKYRLLHPGSGLTDQDVQLLRKVYTQEAVERARYGIITPATPPANAQETAKVQLGKLLYNDPRLSTTNEVSCASCHDLTKGGTDNLAKSEGVPGADGKPQLGGVNAPTVYNAETNIRQFWDGRAADLKEQAGGPPLNPVEMGYAHPSDWNKIAAKLAQSPELTVLFAAAFGDRGITADTITEAIAAYEKTLRTPDSAFDSYLKGNEQALTEAEKAGMRAFEQQGCATCHAGPTLGGQSFEHINTYADLRSLATPDNYTEGAYGLADFTKKEADKDMFRVPNLRNVALTHPYFHTGTVDKLEDAVRIMIQTQGKEEATSEDISAITAFLKAQTGKLKGKPLHLLCPEDVK